MAISRKKVRKKYAWQTFKELGRLYEAGCTHEEAFAALHATCQNHIDVLEAIVVQEGHESLVEYRDFCLLRVRAKLKSVLFSLATEGKDSKPVIAALNVVKDEQSGIDRAMVELNIDEATINRAIDVMISASASKTQRLIEDAAIKDANPSVIDGDGLVRHWDKNS